MIRMTEMTRMTGSSGVRFTTPYDRNDQNNRFCGGATFLPHLDKNDKNDSQRKLVFVYNSLHVT